MRDSCCHTSIPFPSMYCPTSTYKCPGRRVSQSSRLTKFPQPPLKLSVVALQAAWCYFTIVSVPVSSRILQWFVTCSYLGFVVHFNSLTFSSKWSFRVLKSDAWRSEWIPPKCFFLLFLTGKHLEVCYSKNVLCWCGLSACLRNVQFSSACSVVNFVCIAAWNVLKRGPKDQSRRTYTLRISAAFWSDDKFTGLCTTLH